MRYKTKRKIKNFLKVVAVIAVLGALLRFVPEFIPDDVKEGLTSVLNTGKQVLTDTTDSGIKALEDLYNEYMSATGGEKVNVTDNRLAVIADEVPAGMEVPKPVSGHQVVSHPGYVLCYNETYEQPDWVAYALTRDELDANNTGRTENFREDPDIRTDSAHLSDYRNSGYDRGHLLPSADRTSSTELNDATFLLSNMSPQVHRFNAGLWLKAEGAVRDAARQYGTLYVATGPVFGDDMDTIGECNVAVPKEFYKVLLGVDADGAWQSIGMILPQEYKDGNLKPYFMSVNEVEKATGLDFFPSLDDRIEEQVEGSYDIKAWPSSFR